MLERIPWISLSHLEIYEKAHLSSTQNYLLPVVAMDHSKNGSAPNRVLSRVKPSAFLGSK